MSLSRSADVLIATQVKDDFRIHLFDAENPSAAPQILAAAQTVAFAPDGKIVFSSAMTGNSEIWSVNPDGGERRQLTSDAADDWAAAISPDNHSIFFASNRTGETHVWRMNADGGNQMQITIIDGGFPIAVSPDGRWVYYSSALQKTLRRVSTEGGAEETVLDKPNDHFAVSPDGSSVAFAERRGGETNLSVAALSDKRIVKVFVIAGEKINLTHLAWSPDGKSLAYILADGEFKNNALWRQPLTGKFAAPQRVADLGDAETSELFGFALAPDGRHFAVAQGGWLHDAVLLRGLK